MTDVVLPVLNEVEAIPWVLGRLPEGHRAIVVDNGSSDGSGVLAKRLGARVVAERTPGFGAACAALVPGARRPERGAWPAHARLANRVLALEVRRRGGGRLRDIGPMRAARAGAPLALGTPDRPL